MEEPQKFVNTFEFDKEHFKSRTFNMIPSALTITTMAIELT